MQSLTTIYMIIITKKHSLKNSCAFAGNRAQGRPLQTNALTTEPKSRLSGAVVRY